MKIKITIKDPDGIYGAIHDAVRDEVQAIGGLDATERLDLIDSRQEQVKESLKHWIAYSQYIELEFDTEAKTATVLPA